MPVATSSRRKQSTRRLNSEDIEDARNTQANGPIDDVSDEDRPRTTKRPVLVKKEKEPRRSNGKQRADPEDDEDEEDDDDNEEDDDDRIDVQNFPDQPLRKEDMTRLQGYSKDWFTMSEKISQNWEIYRDVGVAMAEAGEKGEREFKSSKELQRLDRDMREFMDVIAEMSSHGQSLDSLYQKVMQGEEITNSLEVYRAGVEELKDEYAGKTTRQKYVKEPNYLKFHSAIWEVSNPSDPMPPLTDIIAKEEGDDSDDDDDLEMGGVTQNYNCPITLTRLVDPYTSRICQHSFSADSIKDHFRTGPALKKCPAAGCNKSFTISDCQPDRSLAKKVENYVRHLAANEEDSDAEEVLSD